MISMNFTTLVGIILFIMFIQPIVSKAISLIWGAFFDVLGR